jgi:hypothetical protein
MVVIGRGFGATKPLSYLRRLAVGSGERVKAAHRLSERDAFLVHDALILRRKDARPVTQWSTASDVCRIQTSN